MKNSALPFQPIVLLVLLAACRAHADSATWTGTAADNNWATLGNWSTGATVPGTNPGETATFSGGIAGLITPLPLPAPPPVTDPPTPPTPPMAVKFLNFEGSLTHTFAAVVADPVNRIAIEDAGAVTLAAETAAQGTTANPVPLQITGSATITNNSSSVLTSNINYVGIAGKLLTFDGTGETTVSPTMGTAPGGVVKNGSGTLNLNANNSNVSGGFTINSGIVITNSANGVGNKVLTLNAGLLQVTANQQSNYTAASVNGNFTLSLGGANNQWTFGSTSLSPIGPLTSTNNPVLTIQTVPPVPVPPAAAATSYLTMALNTSAYDGTFKIGGAASGGGLMIGSTVAVGGPKVRVELGEAGVAGAHVIGSRTVLANSSGIVPVVFGELKGANVSGKIGGRINLGTRTTGTQYVIGGLGTDTSLSGSFVDVANSAGNVVVNGNPDATNVSDTAIYRRQDGAAGTQSAVELVKTGTGTLTLLSDNTHTGGTVLNGGSLAISSDGALGAAYDGSLRPFSLILFAAGSDPNYAAADLPDTVLTGGNPTTPASLGLFSTVLGSNGNNFLFLSCTGQANDTDGGAITNTATGSGYTSVPTVSFTGGTPAAIPVATPVATVRVKGLLTFNGGTLKTNAGITSNRATVLAAGGGTIDTNGFDSTLSGVVNGTGNLTKTGAGKLTLTGANTYAGDTVVAAGTLSVNGTSITDTAKLSITGGKVEVTANETVGSLVLGGVPQGAGTYGAPGSGAANPNDTYFTGTGILTVVGGAPVGGYSAWAATNAPGQSPDQDYDQEGVENGIEYFMGVTGPGFTALPVPVNGKITWTKDPAYSGSFMVQTSDTLAADDWDNVPVNGTNPKDNGNSVEYTLPTGQGKIFARLRVNPN